MSITLDGIVTDDVLDVIYLALIQRPADEIAKHAWSGRWTVKEVLGEIFRNEHFLAHIPALLTESKLRYGVDCIRDTNRYYDLLAAAPLTEDQAIALMERYCFGGEYYEFHKRRFAELHSLVSVIDVRQSLKRMLEISTMPFTTNIWHQYLRELDLLTIDLPSEKGGPTTATVTQWGSNKHVSVDLNLCDLNKTADCLIMDGKFDIIIAAEVVEHLQRDFSEIVELCLRCLSPEGVVVVTTPNANRLENIRHVLADRNPQQRFLGYNHNHGGHYHFREYTMSEMVKDIRSKGGTVISQIYSGCVFDEISFPTEAYHWRTDLVVLFGHLGNKLRL